MLTGALLRYTFFTALILCNLMFFLDIEGRSNPLVQLVLGEPDAVQKNDDRSNVRYTQMKEKRSFGFSIPSRAAPASH